MSPTLFAKLTLTPWTCRAGWSRRREKRTARKCATSSRLFALRRSAGILPASLRRFDFATHFLRLAAGMPRDLHARCVRYLLDAPAPACYSGRHEQSREREVARRARPLRSLRWALRAGDV